MSIPAWIAVSVLGAAIAWVGLALAGAVRELHMLRERVAMLEEADASHVRLPGGLPVGAPEPEWEIREPGGAIRRSAAFRGRRHLVVFADAECRACDDLVPEVVRASSVHDLPPSVVVGRGDPEATPDAWLGGADDGRVSVGAESDRAVSDAFRTDVSPHVFLVDEGGFVAAQGGATSLADVETMVRAAAAMRIVGGTTDG